MKRSFMLLAPLALIIAVAIWFECRPEEPIQVGMIVWLRSGAVVGSSELHAGDLFLEEHPESRIKMAPVDDEWNPDKATAAIEQAMRSGVRFFVSSHPSNCAVASMNIFAKPNALVINAASTSPALTGKDDYFLRIIPDAEQEQRSIARRIHELPGDRILVLQDEGNLPYTDPAFKFFSSELEALGKWRIVHRTLKVSNFNPAEFKSLMAEKFDALFILAGSFQPAIGNMAQLFHRLHPEAPIMLTPWASSPAILEIAGPAVSRIILPGLYPSRHSDSAIGAYFRRFQNRFGYQPHAMTIGVRQAVELLEHAFADGRRTPEEVKKYLLSVPTHQTSLGPISFDQYGDVAGNFIFVDEVDKELK